MVCDLLLFKAVLITRPFDLVSFYPKSKTTLLQSQNIDTFGVTFVGVNFVFVLTLELALSCSVYLVKSRNFINELLKCLFDISSLSLQFLLSTTWNFLIFEESHIHFFSMWFWRGGCLKVLVKPLPFLLTETIFHTIFICGKHVSYVLWKNKYALRQTRMTFFSCSLFLTHWQLGIN